MFKKNYFTIFNEELGCLKGIPVHLTVIENAHLKFYECQAMPLSLKDRVKKKIYMKKV